MANSQTFLTSAGALEKFREDKLLIMKKIKRNGGRITISWTMSHQPKMNYTLAVKMKPLSARTVCLSQQRALILCQQHQQLVKHLIAPSYQMNIASILKILVQPNQGFSEREGSPKHYG